MGETIKFEGNSGSPPIGWDLTKTGRGDPIWTLVQEPSAASGSLALKQSGVAAYPIALKRGTQVRDGTLEVKFKAVTGREDRAGGLIWRAKDANNYYVVRANALEDNVVLYKTVNGVRSPLDIVGRSGGYGVKIPVPSDQWHTLRVVFAGTRFAVSFNGKSLFEVEDETFQDAGLVGLWTKADSVTLFDKLALTILN